MMKLLGLGIGFVLIITLVIHKKPLALAMAAGTLVTGLGAGLGLEWLAGTWWRAITHPDTLELAAMVGSITLLSWIMAVSGLHERLVQATIRLLHSAKLAVMFIPPLIGALPIPGGAIVSAPLLDRPGELLGLSQTRKAAINMVFRHASFFFLPFSSPLILASKMLDVDVFYLIRFLAPLGVAIWIVGYFTLVHRLREVRLEDPAAAAPGEVAASLDGNGESSQPPAVTPAASPANVRPPNPGPSPGREFLVSGSPILIAIVIGLALPVPFWVGVICGILLALGLGWRVRRWVPGDLWKGLDLNLVAAMFGIMSFRAVVVGGESLSQLAMVLERSAIPLPVLAFASSLLISTVSANHNTTLGIAYPMFLPLVAQHEVMAYAMLMFAGSFIAYFASPLHLCQILTNEYCKVTLPQAIREYVWVLAGVAVAAWALFFAYTLQY